MSDLLELLKRRRERVFAHWDGFVPSELISESEIAISRLIDRLVALGPEPTREQIQEEIDKCVQRFNDLDQGWKHSWICTIEREDICEELQDLIALCGYDGSEQGWIRGRDW